MILNRLLLNYNVYILATYGNKLSFNEYCKLIKSRFFSESDDHELIGDFHDDIHKHHREFYIHHSSLYEHNILKDPKLTLPSLVSYIESTDLVEGMDYIITDGNGDMKNGPFKNVIKLTHDSKISDFVMIHNWRVFNQNRTVMMIEQKPEFKIKRAFRGSIHIFVTPQAFHRLSTLSNSNDRIQTINYYINYRFTTHGYMQYIKLGHKADDSRISFRDVLTQDGEYNDTKRIDSIRPDVI